MKNKKEKKEKKVKKLIQKQLAQGIGLVNSLSQFLSIVAEMPEEQRNKALRKMDRIINAEELENLKSKLGLLEEYPV